MGLEDGLAFVKNKVNIFNPDARANFIDYFKIPEINSKIRKIETDGQNNLWVTTEYSGIVEIKYPTNDIKQYKVFVYGCISKIIIMCDM